LQHALQKEDACMELHTKQHPEHNRYMFSLNCTMLGVLFAGEHALDQRTSPVPRCTLKALPLILAAAAAAASSVAAEAAGTNPSEPSVIEKMREGVGECYLGGWVRHN
jgi:hypothetical protein